MRQFELVTEDIRFEQIRPAQGNLAVDDLTNKYQTFLILVGIAGVVAMWYHLAQARRAIRQIEPKENNN